MACTISHMEHERSRLFEFPRRSALTFPFGRATFNSGLIIASRTTGVKSGVSP